MIETYIDISAILFISTWILVPAIILLLVIQTHIYKNVLDPVYFNDSHFNSYELSIFNSFPLFFMKTLAYVRAIIFPNTMLIRFENTILSKREHPFVYYLALLTMLFIIVLTIIFINSVIAGIVFYIYF